MRRMLKEILEKDEICTERLEELSKRGVSYEKFWNDTLYSEVSISFTCKFINTLFINICFINICSLLHRYLEGTASKKGTTSVALKKTCGQRLGSIELLPSMKILQENR
jgi:hypothetical protein